ncbi:MAG: LysR substrate-binding domain-containing protein [Alphaproteobacteria bacterium]|nr:LysR substrate-binding domain-containing protein [Alphaproteobacteria bacterium]
MNLRDLEYVAAIADFGTMARAAEACHVSQSTLSIQLKKLEGYLGVAIFERNGKRLALTQAGQSIVDAARGIVRDSRRLRDIAASYRDPLAVTFRLGAFPTLAPYYLPKIMPGVGKAFPRLTLRLIEEKSPVLTEKLLAGEIDAALLALPVDGANLQSVELFRDPFLLACSTQHPLAKRKSVTMEDVAEESLMLLDDGHCLRNQALEFCALAHVKENGEFRATSLETLRQMVAAGAGVTLMPRIAAVPTPRLAYVPFAGKNAPSRSIGLVWRASSTQKKLIDALAKMLKKSLPKCGMNLCLLSQRIWRSCLGCIISQQFHPIFSAHMNFSPMFWGCAV